MTKLVKCKDCDNKISKKAKSCPECGCPQKRTSIVTKWFLYLFIFTGVMVGVGSIIGPSDSNSVQRQYSSPSRAATPAQQPRNSLAEKRLGISQCGASSTASRQTRKVSASSLNLRKGPGTNFEKLINAKATAALGKTHYLTVDNTTTLFEECTQSGWSKVRVTEPDWLQDTHLGWVSSKSLHGQNLDAGGTEVYTVADIYFDRTTSAFKETIVTGVNKIARENNRCPRPDLGSVALSPSRSTPGKPVFFVACGSGANVFNAYFSESDIANNVVLKEKQNVERSSAIEACEQAAKASATHPSSVSFSKLLDLSVNEHASGRTRITSTFKAKNAFNLELKYDIDCLFDGGRMIETQISESTN